VATHGFELGNDGPSLIVVGVDGSEHANRAGSYAAGLARRQGSRLVGIYVRPVSGLAGLSAAAANAIAQAHDAIASELEAGAALARTMYGLDLELVVREGDPAQQIARLADELRADGVVVGASSRGGLLVGSIPQRLVRAGRWPVTVVP
jgi:nucleotide-binding universal stress UspA family protein